MPTQWFYPSSVTQYSEAENHIPWLNVGDDFTKLNFIRTTKDLKHIANPLIHDIKMKTNYLVVTGFDWADLPTTINGIEVYIDIRRVGRIFDETVQLYSGSPIGDNKGTAELANLKTYGGETDLWGFETISPNMFTSNFGLLLRYQSHPSIPHSTTPNLDHIQIRVW